MGTKKGQRRKTARRAYEKKKSREDYPRYPDDPDSSMGRMVIKQDIANMIFEQRKKGRKSGWFPKW